MPFNPNKFAEKYKLALESASKERPNGGLNGFELEWNLLDEQFKPLLTVGSGPAQQSFVDYLRAECLPDWLGNFSQLEVFHVFIPVQPIRILQQVTELHLHGRLEHVLLIWNSYSFILLLFPFPEKKLT